jgi:hypothetical protein
LAIVIRTLISSTFCIVFWNGLIETKRVLESELQAPLDRLENALEQLNYWSKQAEYMKMDLDKIFPGFHSERALFDGCVKHCKVLLSSINTLIAFYDESVINVPVNRYLESSSKFLLNMRDVKETYLQGPFAAKISTMLQNLLDFHVSLIMRLQTPAIAPYYETISIILGFPANGSDEEGGDTVMHVLDVKTLIGWMFYGTRENVSWKTFRAPLENLENIAFMEQHTQRSLEEIDRCSRSLSLALAPIENHHRQVMVSNLISLNESLGAHISSINLIGTKKLSEHLSKYQSVLLSRLSKLQDLLKLWQRMQERAIGVIRLFVHSSIESEAGLSAESETARIVSIEESFQALIRHVVSKYEGLVFNWMQGEPNVKLQISAVERNCEAILTHLKSWLDTTRLSCPRLFLCSDEEILDSIERKNPLMLIPRYLLSIQIFCWVCFIHLQ